MKLFTVYSICAAAFLYSGFINASPSNDENINEDVTGTSYTNAVFEGEPVAAGLTNNQNTNHPAPVHRIYETAVGGGKPARGRADTVTRLRGEELQRTATYTMGDAAKTLQTMPGVSSTGGVMDSRMFIQGGNWWEMIASMNNTYFLSPTRWGGAVSMFNPNSIDSLDLYTAGYPANYGQALSGILVVNAKEGNPERPKLMLDIGSASAEIMLDSPIGKKTSFFFNMRRSYYDLFAPYFMAGDTEGIQFPYLWDSILNFSVRPAPWSRFNIMIYGAMEGMDWDFSAGQEQTADDVSGLTGKFFYRNSSLTGALQYFHDFAPGVTLSARYSRTPEEFRQRFDGKAIAGSEFEFSQEFNLKGTQDIQQASIDFHYAPGTRNILMAGIMYLYYTADAGGKMVLSMLEGSKPKYISNNFEWDDIAMDYRAAYIRDDFQPLPGVILQVGLRAEHVPVIKEQNMRNSEQFDEIYQMSDSNKTNAGKWNLSPRGGIKWEMNDRFDLFARTGLYNAYPLSVFTLDEEMGNPRVVSEKAVHYISGADYEDRKFCSRAEVFFKQYRSLLTDDVRFNQINSGIRDIWGFDIYLQKKSTPGTPVSGWISYTWADAREMIRHRYGSKDDYRSDAPPVKQWYTPSELRRHTLSAIVEFTHHAKQDQKKIIRLFDKAHIDFNFRLLSGEPVTPVTNVERIDIPANPYTGTPGTSYYRFLYGQYNSDRTPLQHKLDIKLGIPRSPFSLFNKHRPRVKTETYISFFNIYNKANVTSYSWKVKKEYRDKAPKPENITGYESVLLGSEAVEKQYIRDMNFMVMAGVKAEF